MSLRGHPISEVIEATQNSPFRGIVVFPLKSGYLQFFNRPHMRHPIPKMTKRVTTVGPTATWPTRWSTHWLTWPLAKRIAISLIISPIAIGLISCEEDAYDSDNTATIPNASNTAGVQSAPELAIIYPEGNPGDNSAFIQVAENDPTVTQVNAQDAPGSTLIYRLQDGEDMNKFVMDETTGSLSFKELPDWERPHDADGNNNYMVLWQVVSSTGEARSQFLVIQVTDLPD